MFLILIIIMLLILSGCANDNTQEDIQTKVIQELDYLDTQIISMLNSLNNISLQNYTVTSEQINTGSPSSNNSSEESGGSSGGSQGSSGGSQESTSGGQESQSGGENQESGGQGQNSSENGNITITQMESQTVLNSDENDIDWTTIKTEIETIDESWGIILLDLASLNINNDDILNFSKTLDDCILSIKDENKEDALVNLAKLYSFVPKYESAISASNDIQIIKETKSNIINAYSVIEKEDWNTAKTNINQADETFRSITNNIDYIKNNEYKVNKTYVLINELNNSLSYQDKKLFYVKYKNLLESINTL